jgi:hypothetical protein
MITSIQARIRALPPTDDYGAACTQGRRLAVEYMHWLTNNPSMIGSNGLGHVASCFPVSDGTNGYAVGFYSHLERFIAAAAQGCDLDADLARCEASSARIKANRNRNRKPAPVDETDAGALEGDEDAERRAVPHARRSRV